MNCILNVCQAYEMFFSLYLRVELIYKPLFRSSGNSTASLEHSNCLLSQLEKKTKRYAFADMRALFLERVIVPDLPGNLDEVGKLIDSICQPGIPKDHQIESVKDAKLAELLMMVKKTGINALRNKVVHKSGYRPTREEAEKAHEEAKSILFPLTSYLKLHDDINSYWMRQS